MASTQNNQIYCNNLQDFLAFNKINDFNSGSTAIVAERICKISKCIDVCGNINKDCMDILFSTN